MRNEKFFNQFQSQFVFQTNLFFSETKTKVIPNCVYLLKKGSSRFQDKVNKEQKEGEKQRNFNPRNEKSTVVIDTVTLRFHTKPESSSSSKADKNKLKKGDVEKNSKNSSRTLGW